MPGRSDTAPAGSAGGCGASRATPGLSEAAPWQSRPQEPGEGVVVVLALCIALAPLVSPKGPGNGGPIDVFVAVGVTTTLLWAVRSRARLQFPYFIPVSAFVTVGLAGGPVELGRLPWRHRRRAGDLPVPLVRRAGHRVPHAPRARILLRTWALSATVWAGAAHRRGVRWRVPAVRHEARGTRARLFFDHPNMAGNFFMIALFLVVASGYPRRRSLRYACCGVLLVATFLTGSNAAMLSLVGGARAWRCSCT